MKIIRPLPEKKICSDCKKELHIVAFGKSKNVDSPRGFYYRPYCVECGKIRCKKYGAENKQNRNARLRAWRKKNPEAARMKDRRAALKKKYGLTIAEADMLKAEFNGRCWICRTAKAVVIDHCHNTGKVRGSLCHSCNTFLGRVEAIDGLLKRMKDYLTSPCHADVLLEIANSPPPAPVSSPTAK